MSSKRNNKNKTSKFDKFMAILIGIIVTGLFTIGYAIELYDTVREVVVSDTESVTDTEKAEHSNAADSITTEINITNAYYTTEVDGQKVRRKIENVQNGTVTIIKSSDDAEDNKNDDASNETDKDIQAGLINGRNREDRYSEVTPFDWHLSHPNVLYEPEGEPLDVSPEIYQNNSMPQRESRGEE